MARITLQILSTSFDVVSLFSPEGVLESTDAQSISTHIVHIKWLFCMYCTFFLMPSSSQLEQTLYGCCYVCEVKPDLKDGVLFSGCQTITMLRGSNPAAAFHNSE